MLIVIMRYRSNPPKNKKNLISKELHEKSVYSIMIVQENKTEDHEF